MYILGCIKRTFIFFCSLFLWSLFHVSIYPTLSPQVGCDTRSSFKQSKIRIQNFPSHWLVALPKLKNPIYLPIGGERTYVFMTFPKTLVPSGTETASWVVNSISYYNHYTKDYLLTALYHLHTKGWSFESCGQVHLPRKQHLINQD